jgi:hypothetical protein
MEIASPGTTNYRCRSTILPITVESPFLSNSPIVQLGSPMTVVRRLIFPMANRGCHRRLPMLPSTTCTELSFDE